MYRKALFFSLLGVAGCVPALAAGHPSVPPASFLEYHVGSVPELSQEVTVSPVVRTRLARHFHISEAAMSRYIQNNLILSRLQTTGNYQVACVRPGGQEYWVKARLLTGTSVFASRATGQPILKLACGNPMVSALPPGRDAQADDNAKMSPPQVSATAASGQGTAVVTPALITDSPAVDTVMVADALPAGAANDLQVEPITKTAGSFEFANFLPSATGLADLAPELAVVTAAAVASSRGGHSGGSSPFAASSFPSAGLPSSGPGHSAPPPPAPVPEASSAISLGGLLLMGSAFWMARRKRLAQ